MRRDSGAHQCHVLVVVVAVVVVVVVVVVEVVVVEAAVLEVEDEQVTQVLLEGWA